MAETDVLDRLLVVAEAEGALGPERLADFARGLRERARLVLDDRVRHLEQRVQDLETASALLEKENAWRSETIAGLEAHVAWLQRQVENLNAAHGHAVAALQESNAVHDRLLAHHRHVTDQAARRFAAAAALPFWKFRARRSLLAESAAEFARELS